MLIFVEIYDQEDRLFNDENDVTAVLLFADLDEMPVGTTIINPESISIDGVVEF